MRRLQRFVLPAFAWLGLAVICGPPIGYAVAIGLHADAWLALDARSGRLMLNSLGVAAGAAAVACILGTPIGIALGRLRTRGERALACAAAVPFLLPPYVSAIAWIDMLGARGLAAQAAGRPLGWLYSPLGASWVLGAGYLTIPAAAVALAARAGAFAGVAPARQVRGGFALIRRIVLPAARPYLVTAAGLVFLIALPEFSVPSLLQVAVYPVAIHTEFAVNYDAGRALALSLPVMVTGIIVLVAMAAHLRRAARPLGESANSPVALPVPLRRAAFVSAYAALGIATLPVLVALVLRARSLTAFSDAWTTAGTEVRASAGVGAVTATLVVAIAFLLTQSFSRARGRAIATAIFALPFLMPGPAVAIALIAAWNHAGWRAAVYDGPQILVLACAARLLAAGAVVIAASRVSRAREWDEAARVFGVSSWRRQAWIALPAAAPALVVAWAIVFVLSSREADAGVLVAPPGFTTISVRLLALMHYGPSEVVAALSLLLVAISIVSAALLAALGWGTLRWVYGATQRS